MLKAAIMATLAISVGLVIGKTVSELFSKARAAA